MLGASVHPVVHLLGGSINVVRTLKVACYNAVNDIEETNLSVINLARPLIGPPTL